MRCLKTAAFVFAMVATAAQSQVTEIASATGSERLTYFASTLDMTSVGGLASVNNFVGSSANIGFNALDTTKSLHGARVSPLSVRPTVRYDDNANGGNKSDKIVFGNGLTLTFPSDSLARQDVVAGLAVSSGARVFYGRGRYLDISAGFGKSWGLSTSSPQLDWNASLCSRNYLSGWSFLDLCAYNSGKRKVLSSSSESRAEVLWTQLAAPGGMPWEIRGKVFRQNASGDWNFGGGLQVLGAINSNVALDLSVESELQSASHKFERYDIYAKAQFNIAGHLLSLKLSQSLLSNGRILGEVHDDTSRSLVASFSAGGWGVINFSLEKTKSRIQFYNTSTIGVSWDVSPAMLKDLWK